jgi:hypothetical protein
MLGYRVRRPYKGLGASFTSSSTKYKHVITQIDPYRDLYPYQYTMPSSPPPLRAPTTAPPVLAPTQALAAGTISRLPLSTPTRRHPTSAEAYATAHTRRDHNKGHKPIFQWISRKLGGTRRATLSDITQTQIPPHTQTQTPLTPIQIFPPARDSISRSESHSMRSYSMSYATSTRRQANNPYPSLPVPPRRTSMADSHSLAPSMSLYMDRSPASSEPSLSGSYAFPGGGGADENASVRAIPPSHPGSPASSAVLNHSNSASLLPPLLRERESMRSSRSSEMDRRRDSGSTKPTTVLSFDSGPHIAHIAQVPISPLRSSNLSPVSPYPITPTPITPGLIRAPRHSLPHPRDNPNPSSPPLDNASTLTLASSTFALPHPPPSIRLSTPIPRAGSTGLATSPSVTFAPSSERERERGSVYVDGGNSSHALSIRAGRGVDRDASVRAVRRKGSWESYESGWSWRGGAGGTQNRLNGGGVEDEVEREGLHTRESFWTAKSRNEEDDGRVTESPVMERGRFSLEASIPITA